jgi:hypothetical protein
MRASRQFKQAAAAQLEAMSEGLSLVIGNDRFINPLLLTSLCDLREEIAAELGRRSKGARITGHRLASCHHVRVSPALSLAVLRPSRILHSRSTSDIRLSAAFGYNAVITNPEGASNRGRQTNSLVNRP